MTDLIPLSLLATGSKAQVQQLLGQPDQVQRLEELGLRHGTTVQMIQRGCPCIIRLTDCKLCFRSNEALGVMVHVDQAS